MPIESPSASTPASTIGNEAWTANWTVGHPALHGEVMDATGGVWLAQAPMTRERFESLALPDGFVKTGIGESVADLAFFRRSPGADADGPCETRDIDGECFSMVARPGVPDSSHRGLFILPVHKHHRLLYVAGRTIEVMDCGDGADYVPLVTDALMAGARPRPEGFPPRALPDGWSVRRVTLERDLVVELPCPTRVTFFRSGESFQGPVRLGL